MKQQDTTARFFEAAQPLLTMLSEYQRNAMAMGDAHLTHWLVTEERKILRMEYALRNRIPT